MIAIPGFFESDTYDCVLLDTERRIQRVYNVKSREQVGQSILKDIIQLMNDLNLSILAEGVETEKR